MSTIPNPKLHAWETSESFGAIGESLTHDLLLSLREPSSWFQTLAITHHRNEPHFQKLGIDFTWYVKAATCCAGLTIEVKADRNHHTSNFFLETISDIERNTPGAFLGTKAEWYFYTFPEIELVHCLPVYNARLWFEQNKDSFKGKIVSSSRGRNAWRTAGVLVPKEEMISGLPDSVSFVRTNGVWRRGAR